MKLFRGILAMTLIASCATPLRAADFMLGTDVFLKGYTQLVAGKRVGLITNQTGRDAAGRTTIDLLHEHPGVNLVALFSPEHGIRGTVAAGEQVDNSRDPKTGLPIYSLYGPQGHRPTDAQIQQVDMLIYDIQDVGSRAYTYIWTMAECLEAAAKAGKSFIILDRPNPHGGRIVDGPLVDPAYKSFLGLYPIPRVYGLTVGELGRYLNGEHQLKAHLIVIPMANYTRDMAWADTGLRWTPPSPNIPSPQSAITFAATGTIGALGLPGMDIGIGTPLAFQVIGGNWLDPVATAKALNARGLPAVTFVPHQFERGDRTVKAVLIRVDDPVRFFPATTELVILQHLLATYPTQVRWPTDKAKLQSFDRAMGTASVREALQAGQSINELTRAWHPRQNAYIQARAKYLLYP